MANMLDFSSIRTVLRRERRRRKVAAEVGKLPPAVFVISFPKCGRTWLLVMVGHYLVNHFGLPEEELLNVGDLHKRFPEIPPIYLKHDDKPRARTCQELIQNKSAYAKHRVLFLVRDPRDVLVSKFYSLKYREGKYSGDLSSYIRRPHGSLATMVEYFNIWLREREKPKAFMLLKYEDLYARREQKLQEVLQFLGIKDVNAANVQRAVEFGTFENMRRFEHERRFSRPLLLPTRPGDFRSYKTRKGIIGDHRNEFSSEDLGYVDGYLRGHLHRAFGYSLVSSEERATLPSGMAPSHGVPT